MVRQIQVKKTPISGNTYIFKQCYRFSRENRERLPNGISFIEKVREKRNKWDGRKLRKQKVS